jgi:hypothetical protein
MNRFRRTAADIAAVIFILVLPACGIFQETYGIQEVDNWVRSNEPLAESGQMKWSVYYAGYFEKIAATPVISEGPVMEGAGIMLTAALFFEQGRLDRAGFDSVRGVMRKYQTVDDAAANLLAREALVRALEQKNKAAPRSSP